MVCRIKAAKLYNVSRSTLIYRLGLKFSKVRPGPNSHLKPGKKQKIVKWIVESYEKGFPKRKTDIQVNVKEFLDQSPRDNPFRGILSGDGCCF